MADARTLPPEEDEDRALEAGAEDRERPLWLRLIAQQTAVVFFVLMAIFASFAVLEPDAFFTVSNVRNMAIDASILLVVAVGMTFVIITSGIDLSVGAVLVFSSVVSAKLMESMGGDGWGVALAGLGMALVAGLGWGIFNGVLVAWARIPPLIVTLGTLGMAQGTALLISKGVNVRDVPLVMTVDLGIGRLWDQIPYLVLIALAVTILAGIALALTRFGRYTHAIGSNEEAARRAGIDVGRHLIKVYALAGMLAGLAGWLSLARFATTQIGGYDTLNLQAIAAVVIGGTSLFGGIGTIFGSAVGVLIPVVLQNGFVILRVQPFWQQVAVGGVLIAAVYVDQLRRRARQRE
jgi:ribose transport system permease protein